MNAATTQATGGVHRHGSQRGGMRQEAMTALAGALGMNESDLKQALGSGRTVAQLAEEKGLSLDQVKDTLVKDVKERLGKDLASGAISQAQHDNLAQRAEAVVDRLVQSGGPVQGTTGPRPASGMPQERMPRTDGPGAPGPKGGLSALAGALGMNASALSSALRGGQSVAQLAKDKGVSLDSVKEALLKDVQQRLSADHESGRLSQQQYDKLARGAQDLVDHLVQGDDTPPDAPPAP